MSLPSAMRALVLRRHGGCENLAVVGDHPVPRPQAGQALVRVRAAAFNYHDVFTMRGMPGIKVPLPVVIGLDMAGEIAALGAGRQRVRATATASSSIRSTSARG